LSILGKPRHLHSAFEHTPVPALVLNPDLIILSFNRAYQRLTHLDRSAIGRLSYDVLPGFDKEQLRLIRRSFERVFENGQADHIPLLQCAVRVPGHIGLQERYWSVSNKPLFDSDGSIIGLLHCASDITELVELRSASQGIHRSDLDDEAREQLHRWTESVQGVLQNERERLHQLFQQSPGFVAVLQGPDYVFELANDAYYQLVGHRPILGKPLAQIMPEVVGQGYLEILDQVFSTGEPFVGRAMPIELQRVAGDKLATRYMDLTYQPMVDGSGQVTGIFVQGNDVTEAHLMAQEVAFQASHDWLTGLNNRREFSRQTDQITGAGPHAILYMDIDHFKIVNDRCGHGAGDELLTMIANKLQSICDGDRDLLARLGGDEFALMRRDCGLEEALGLAERLRAAVKDMAFIWQGQRHSVTLSVGAVSFGPAEGLDFEAAFALAEAACFLAKENGRNRVQAGRLSDEEITQRRQDMDSVTRLKEAMREDRLLLYGQKIVRLQESDSQDPGYCEVLARLRERDGTITGPGTFIPAAERFGLIEELDRHIVSKVFARIDSQPSEQRRQTCYFVNLSGITLSTPGFLDFVERALLAYPGVEPTDICFEVTETAALSNLARTAEAMRRMSTRGFRFALDDFGSGMASFNYLQDLPVQFVKIDGDFIKTVLHKPVSRIIVEAVTKVAHSMNMRTIAESVETHDLTPHLRAMGLDYAQGYALHSPEPL
jgi:diguanylate cyclase (GGDEF)-like protein